MIEIKDPERGSEIDPTSNQVAEELLSTSDLYLTKIRSFVYSGRDILKHIQKEMKETKSSLDQYKSSLDNVIVKLQEGTKNLNELSKELDLKNKEIGNSHFEIDSLTRNRKFEG